MVCFTECTPFQLKILNFHLSISSQKIMFSVFLNLTLGGSATLDFFDLTLATFEARANFQGLCVYLNMTPPVTTLGCPITVNLMFGVPAPLPPRACVAAGNFKCCKMLFA